MLIIENNCLEDTSMQVARRHSMSLTAKSGMISRAASKDTAGIGLHVALVDGQGACSQARVIEAL